MDYVENLKYCLGTFPLPIQVEERKDETLKREGTRKKYRVRMPPPKPPGTCDAYVSPKANETCESISRTNRVQYFEKLNPDVCCGRLGESSRICVQGQPYADTQIADFKVALNDINSTSYCPPELQLFNATGIVLMPTNSTISSDQQEIKKDAAKEQDLAEDPEKKLEEEKFAEKKPDVDEKTDEKRVVENSDKKAKQDAERKTAELDAKRKTAEIEKKNQEKAREEAALKREQKAAEESKKRKRPAEDQHLHEPPRKIQNAGQPFNHDDAVAAHNQCRRNCGVSGILQWDENLARQAFSLILQLCLTVCPCFG